MNVKLYFSGAPLDNECFPQDDKLYFDQFFSYPESSNSVDYEVVVMPKTECIYYTYMKHKNVSGTREGSYFAITLKMTEGYCTDIIGIYSFLDSAYRNFCIGKILNPSAQGGAKYAVRSLSEVENIRKDIEKAFIDVLNARVYPLVKISGSFTSNRQDSNIGTVSVGTYSNDQLVSVLKQSHKLHLIPESDMAKVNASSIQNKVNEYEAKLTAKDGQIAAAQKAQKEAEAEKKKIEKEYADYRAERSKDPTERRWNQIQSDIQAIKTHLSSPGQSRSQGTVQGGKPQGISTGGNGSIGGSGIMANPKLLWGLLAVAFLGIILLVLFPRSKGDKEDISKYEKQIAELKDEKGKSVQKCESLGSEIKVLQDSVGRLNNKIDELNKKKQGAKSAAEGNAKKPEPALKPKPERIDVSKPEPVVGDEVTVRVASKGNTKIFDDIDWEIKNGAECVTKDGNKLKCNKPGKVTLRFYDNEKKTFEREITIKEK